MRILGCLFTVILIGLIAVVGAALAGIGGSLLLVGVFLWWIGRRSRRYHPRPGWSR